MSRHVLIAFAILLVGVSCVGCIGSIRDTTTARTATEMLLISTAAERSVHKFEAEQFTGRTVFIDNSYFDSVDKPYVMSSLRDHLAANGVTIAAEAAGAELVLEIRNASLGIYDGDFVLGIPQLPISAQGFPPLLLPPLYLFRRFSQQGWAKLQFWLFDPSTQVHIYRSPDLWGSSYYNQWWWFGIGPFDGSNDIYPEVGLLDYVPGMAE